MFRFPLTVATSLLLLLAACGGSSSDGGNNSPSPSPTPDAGDATPVPTPAETISPEDAAYYDAVKPALADIYNGSVALEEFLASAFDPSLSESERQANAVEYARRYSEWAQSSREALLISTTESTASRHDALLAIAGDLVAMSEELTATVSSTPPTTSNELASILVELNALTLEERLRDSCFDVQTLGRRMGVEFDTPCPG